MCRIVGIWILESTTVYRREPDNCTDSLTHRGSDGRGAFLGKDGVLWGH